MLRKGRFRLGVVQGGKLMGWSGRIGFCLKQLVCGYPRGAKDGGWWLPPRYIWRAREGGELPKGQC